MIGKKDEELSRMMDVLALHRDGGYMGARSFVKTRRNASKVTCIFCFNYTAIQK